MCPRSNRPPSTNESPRVPPSSSARRLRVPSRWALSILTLGYERTQSITLVPTLITGTRNETGRPHPELTLAAEEFDNSLLAQGALGEYRVCSVLLVLKCAQPRTGNLGGSPGGRENRLASGIFQVDNLVTAIGNEHVVLLARRRIRLHSAKAERQWSTGATIHNTRMSTTCKVVTPSTVKCPRLFQDPRDGRDPETLELTEFEMARVDTSDTSLRGSLVSRAQLRRWCWRSCTSFRACRVRRQDDGNLMHCDTGLRT
jgi:hypothetical protein